MVFASYSSLSRVSAYKRCYLIHLRIAAYLFTSQKPDLGLENAIYSLSLNFPILVSKLSDHHIKQGHLTVKSAKVLGNVLYLSAVYIRSNGRF